MKLTIFDFIVSEEMWKLLFTICVIFVFTSIDLGMMESMQQWIDEALKAWIMGLEMEFRDFIGYPGSLAV